MTPNKKIRIALDIFESQILFCGYTYDKDIPLFNALQRLRRQILE